MDDALGATAQQPGVGRPRVAKPLEASRILRVRRRRPLSTSSRISTRAMGADSVKFWGPAELPYCWTATAALLRTMSGFAAILTGCSPLATSNAKCCGCAAYRDAHTSSGNCGERRRIQLNGACNAGCRTNAALRKPVDRRRWPPRSHQELSGRSRPARRHGARRRRRRHLSRRRRGRRSAGGPGGYPRSATVVTIRLHNRAAVYVRRGPGLLRSQRHDYWARLDFEADKLKWCEDNRPQNNCPATTCTCTCRRPPPPYHRRRR